MKFQLAMDMTNEDQFWEVLSKTQDLIDIVEIGNIGTYLGAQLIPKVRAKYPRLEIVWDQNVRSLYANIPAINLGADYVSVDASATDEDFILHLEYAKKLNCKIVANMNVDTAGSAQMFRLEDLGVDQISFHPNAHERLYPAGDVLQLQIAKLILRQAEISVHGGFTLGNVYPVLEFKPDVVVVGAAIWSSADPRKITKDFHELLAKYR